MEVNKIHLIIVFVVYFLAAFFSKGHHHPDEHHQILEFAGYQLGITEAENLAWEYEAKIRPALQPTIAYTVGKIMQTIGVFNPFRLTFVLRLLSAVLSILASLSLIRAFLSFIPSKDFKWLVFLSFFLWFSIYNGVRFSSENWSGAIFIMGVSWLIKPIRSIGLNYVLVGCLFGLSFVFRYQSGFLVLGAGLWLLFVNKIKFKNLFAFAISILLVMGIGTLVDRLFYGEWIITAINYAKENLVNNRAAEFGVSPWWYYFSEVFTRAFPPIGLILLLGVFWFFIKFPKHIITWSVIPFVLVHMLIGHKELRFLFPIIGFLPIMVLLGWQKRPKIAFLKFAKPWFKVTFKLVWILNLLGLLLVCFKPANQHISLYKFIYENYREPITAYSIGGNPYTGYPNVYFYRNKFLEVQKVKTVGDLFETNEKRLIITESKKLAEQFPEKYRLVFSEIPDWMKSFNVNNWVDRTSFWVVYEIGEE